MTINDFYDQDNGQNQWYFEGTFGMQGAANQYGDGLGEPIPASVGMDSIKLVIEG